MWPKCLSVRTLKNIRRYKESRSRRRENGSISISIWTLRGMKTDGCGTPDSRSPPASTRPLRPGMRSCGFPTRPWNACAATGNTLRVNFFRGQGSPPNRKAIVWQPTHRPTFHVPEVFGTLRLWTDINTG